ncbi:MAG: acyl-CoA dehydrogenase family protein, partial [Mycobacterium sp.]|nr:acyl-CoA dehydrogenase family protein [Mycobacterium sp.]
MKVAQFRTDLRVWLDEHDLTPGPDHSLEGHIKQLARVHSALYDAGWMRYGWPEKVGGLGGPAMLRAIVGEEVVGRRLAEPGPYSMVEVLAPTMIDYAPAELAAEMVPRLLSGREQWCQGFSEPGSGSDLASLTTRAAPRGDDWIVNGQKVWTSYAQYSTRCILLTRTAPGYDGITAFFVDLDTPGITIRPLRTMHGVDEFCEVYFDDVVVPAARMLGRPGDGWRLAMDLLPYERSTCFWQRIAYLYARFDELIAETCDPDEYELGAAYLALHTL